MQPLETCRDLSPLSADRVPIYAGTPTRTPWPGEGAAPIGDAFYFDAARSRPFHPHLDFNRAGTPDITTAIGSDSVAAAVRRSRQQRYADRLATGWQGPRLLVDGDSWLHFPLVRDLVVQLDSDHAIDCLAGEGDPLRNPIRARRIGDAIVEQRPDAVLLSVGGGDVLDGFRLPAFIEPFSRRRLAQDYPSAYFIACLHRELLPRIVALIKGIRSIDARVPILLHSYAYGRPRDFIWLGRPLREAGIADPALQRGVVAALVDRYHTALVQAIAIAGLRHVDVVDCRDAVGANWFDELHPNNAGFETIAGRFRAALSTIL
jgi:lysophospholipase L1-like esterase